jgi:hypothetical protein
MATPIFVSACAVTEAMTDKASKHSFFILAANVIMMYFISFLLGLMLEQSELNRFVFSVV